jgi:uncharacterized membrane protein
MSDPVTPTAVPASAGVTEDRTVAILAYITPILMGVGIVIAILIHNGKKTALGAFHLRQSLGLLVACIACWVAMVFIGFIPVLNMTLVIIGPLLGLTTFVLWIIGLLAAINGQMKPLPVLGPHIEKLLGTTFN